MPKKLVRATLKESKVTPPYSAPAQATKEVQEMLTLPCFETKLLQGHVRTKLPP